MDDDRRLGDVEPLMPLSPVPRRRLIARIVIAPFLWLTALVVVAITTRRTEAIELGLLIAGVSLVVSVVVLAVLRAGRDRERARYDTR